MEEIGCGGGYGVGRGDEGGGWSRIKDEVSRIEFVEHNTTFGHNVMNEDDIEDFKVFTFSPGEFSNGRYVMSENDIENFASV